ncbi:MAG: peptide ABC transporter substrate-binding protein, partial [Acidianus infernus]|nr:peptide ABC transporter substrate-binding protein [Acidianus infernus]
AGVAQSKGIDWLNLVSPKDVGYIISALQNASSMGYIPESLLQVENLSNITLVTPQQAIAGYQAAISFMKTYGNALIGNGPFMLVAWNPSASPPYAKIVRNPYFHLMPPAEALSLPEIFYISFSVPSTVTVGQTLNGTVMSTPAGSTTARPASNVTVYLELLYPNGTIISSLQEMTNANGQFTFTVPTNLSPGSYLLTIVAYKNTSILINPVTYTLVVLPSTTTTNNSTVVSTVVSTVISTVVSTVTTSASNVGYLAVITVLIIIIIVLAVLLLRRR